MLSAVPLQRSLWARPLLERWAEAGYRDGDGMALEYRSSEEHGDRLTAQARELAAAKCDLMYAIGPEAPARALQAARSASAVVFVAVDYDPVERGIVASLSRPDRNTTGIYVPQAALVAKRFEIMREVVPRARTMLVLVDSFSRDQLGPLKKAADAARVQLAIHELSAQPYDFEAAFQAGRRAKCEALIGVASPAFSARRHEIGALLARQRMPAIGSNETQAQAGYLLSLGPDVTKTTRRAAEIGIRILKGARPADLPVEQADEFELTVNAKAAADLGIKMPESVLARAVRIIP